MVQWGYHSIQLIHQWKYKSCNCRKNYRRPTLRLTHLCEVFKVFMYFKESTKKDRCCSLFFMKNEMKFATDSWQFSVSCWIFFAGRYEILRFLLFVVKAGNVAVLCQKTPTHPMCSCSLLLYISTHTARERERRIFQYTVHWIYTLQRDESAVTAEGDIAEEIADIDTVKAENNESVIKEAILRILNTVIKN